MMSRSVFHQRRILLQISCCSVLFFYLNLLDCTDQLPSTASLDMADFHHVDNNRELVPTKYSSLPSLSNNAVLYKSFVAILSIMAMSLIIAQCIRSIKSRGYFRKSRRLSDDTNKNKDTNTTACYTLSEIDGTAFDENQRSPEDRLKKDDSKTDTAYRRDSSASEDRDINGEDPLEELQHHMIYFQPGYGGHKAYCWCGCCNTHMIWKHEEQSWPRWFLDRLSCIPQRPSRNQEPDYRAGGPPGAPGSGPKYHDPNIQPCQQQPKAYGTDSQ